MTIPKDLFDQVTKAIASVEAAEKMAPAGSFEHSQYVKGALMSAWPIIRAYLRLQAAPSAPHA